jgi:RNA polymerase sigma factor (sigma-70 family)
MSPDETSLSERLSETAHLLERARTGNRAAMNALFERYLPILRRWTSGRLPFWARDLAETQDLVQDTLLQVFRNLDTFEYRGGGAFLAYLRHAVMNRLRNEIRRADRRPLHDAVPLAAEDGRPSPIEHAIGAEALERYEKALDALTPTEREAVVARIELGLSYEALADRLGKPSADAARMTVARALVKLAGEMEHG